MLLAVLPAEAQTEAPEGSYAIQVNASEEAELIAAQLDSLRRRGLPAYRTRTSRGGVTYHRLRLGPFPRREMARSFARCRGYTEGWIVSAGGDPVSAGASISGLATDVVPLRPQKPSYLLGRRHAFAALLRPAYGAVAQPYTLRVYRPASSNPVVIESVTGIRESEEGVKYGRAERVFVRDTTETVSEYAAEIEAFSRQHQLSKYLVQDQLALYDGGRMARFTLLGILPLPGGSPQVHKQPGFDYVDADGHTVRHRGIVGEEIARAMGNAAMRPVAANEPTWAATPRVAFYARPTERGENVQVCMLFFGEQ